MLKLIYGFVYKFHRKFFIRHHLFFLDIDSKTSKLEVLILAIYDIIMFKKKSQN